MRLQETIAFYLLVGVGVAAAMLLAATRRTKLESWLVPISAVLFWPMYLPLLLSRPPVVAQLAEAPNPPCDEMAATIAKVNSELDAALSSLDGWAENVLTSERGRLAELRNALAAHAERIRAIDKFLADCHDCDETETVKSEPLANNCEQQSRKPSATNSSSEILVRRQASEMARVQNIARLAEVRRQSYDDLMATLAWIRELVSMIHLAKFTGAPASRAEELVAQIAAAVEGISVVAAEPNGRAPSKWRGPISNSFDESAADEPIAALQLISVPPGQDRSIDKWASSNAPAI